MGGAKTWRHEHETTESIAVGGEGELAAGRQVHAAVLVSQESAHVHATPVDDLPDSAGLLEDHVSRGNRIPGDFGALAKHARFAAIAALFDVEVLRRPFGHARNR